MKTYKQFSEGFVGKLAGFAGRAAGAAKKVAGSKTVQKGRNLAGKAAANRHVRTAGSALGGAARGLKSYATQGPMNDARSSGSGFKPGVGALSTNLGRGANQNVKGFQKGTTTGAKHVPGKKISGGNYQEPKKANTPAKSAGGGVAATGSSGGGGVQKTTSGGGVQKGAQPKPNTFTSRFRKGVTSKIKSKVKSAIGYEGDRNKAASLKKAGRAIQKDVARPKLPAAKDPKALPPASGGSPKALPPSGGSGASKPAATTKPTPTTGSKPAAKPTTGSKPAAKPTGSKPAGKRPSLDQLIKDVRGSGSKKPAAKPTTGSKPTPTTGSKPTPTTGSKPAAKPTTGSKPAAKPTTGSKPTPTTGTKPAPKPPTKSGITTPPSKKQEKTPPSLGSKIGSAVKKKAGEAGAALKKKTGEVAKQAGAVIKAGAQNAGAAVKKKAGEAGAAVKKKAGQIATDVKKEVKKEFKAGVKTGERKAGELGQKIKAGTKKVVGDLKKKAGESQKFNNPAVKPKDSGPTSPKKPEPKATAPKAEPVRGKGQQHPEKTGAAPKKEPQNALSRFMKKAEKATPERGKGQQHPQKKEAKYKSGDSKPVINKGEKKGGALALTKGSDLKTTKSSSSSSKPASAYPSKAERIAAHKSKVADLKKKGVKLREELSFWREEFIWETDKKYPDKVKQIKPMTGTNTIIINPEDETAKYTRKGI